MVNEHMLDYRAFQMIKGGMTQAQIARDLDVGVAIFRCWQARDRRGDTLENHTGRGRKSTMSRLAKIIVAKAASESHHSARTPVKK